MTPESNPAVGDGLILLLSLKCALLLMMLLLALIAQTHIKHPFSIASSQVGLEGRQQKQEEKNNEEVGEKKKKGYYRLLLGSLHKKRSAGMYIIWYTNIQRIS
jgi:hypothetical protein